MGLIRGLWNISQRSWVDMGGGLRPGSHASRLHLFLVLVFLVIGLALVLLGFDLAAVDRWLDARADGFDLVGTLLFKALLAVILLSCVLGAGAVLYGRFAPGEEDRPGWGVTAGALIGTLILGYLAWVGLMGPL
nr:hypothetical protein [uncultured Roseococcus sp.]